MTCFCFAALPRHRKAPKERTGRVTVSVLPEDEPIATGDTAAAIDTTLLQGSCGLPQEQQCNSPESSLIALEADEADFEGAATTVNARVPVPEAANSSYTELNKQLVNLTRKYNKLQELHTQANSTIHGLRGKVKKHESTIEAFRKNVKFLNDDQIQALSRSSNKGNT